MKPPAKIDGLLQFKKDLPGQFTLEEQAAIWRSEAGQLVRNALFRCEGHSKQWMDARQKLKELVESGGDPKSQQVLKMRRETILKKLKYVDCLAYMMSKQQWNQYTMCWVQTVGNLSPNELRNYKEQGALEMICRTQRDSLEREVGSLVSRAVEAGDSVALQAEVDFLPLR